MYLYIALVAIVGSCCAAEVVQKEGTKLASRQEFAKRVALDLFRCVLPLPCSSVPAWGNWVQLPLQSLWLHAFKQHLV